MKSRLQKDMYDNGLIHNSWELDPIQMPTNRRLDKQAVVYSDMECSAVEGATSTYW